MVDAADIAVSIPAIAQIKAVEFLKVLFGRRAIELDPAFLQPQIDQDAEELPVVVGKVELAGMLKVGRKIVLGLAA
jgi:hypothetical protein